jgi:hypothetical protein
MNREVGVKMEKQGGSGKWPVGLFVIVLRSWFGGSWVKVNFEDYRVVAGRKCRDGLRFRYWASFRECYV